MFHSLSNGQLDLLSRIITKAILGEESEDNKAFLRMINKEINNTRFMRERRGSNEGE